MGNHIINIVNPDSWLTYMNFKLAGVATLGISPVSRLKLRSLSKPNSKDNDYLRKIH